MRRYRALATEEALGRLVTRMPVAGLAALARECAARGETLREHVGRIALNGDRLQDVEFVEVK